MILDLAGRPINVGDRICFTTKTEAPGLRFGVVSKVGQRNPKHTYSREVAVQITETDHKGNTLTKHVYEHPYVDGKMVLVKVDTGKPIVVNLRVNECDRDGNDVKDYRLWVIQ